MAHVSMTVHAICANELEYINFKKGAAIIAIICFVKEMSVW